MDTGHPNSDAVLPRADVYDVLLARGFVQQVTDEAAVRQLFAAGPVTAYIGYDPTAVSLHVGNLVTLMALKHLERHGHRPLVLLGGATAMVGDPSGKTQLRQMLTPDQITENTAGVVGQIGRFLNVHGGNTRVVNNADWLLGLQYIAFLRDVGRHFSVNRMLSAEAYKQRLERGLSFIELNYQILQAYDFVELARRYNCCLQMGGDDQWGNIVAGVDLCRRIAQKEVQGLTFPLLLTATGQKMGKTESGAIWLDPERVSPFAYYQYWINVHDDDVARMLGYFTFLPMDEIAVVRQMAGGIALNMAKAILAYEATALAHGENAAREAHQAAQGAFGGRAIDAGLLPSSHVPRAAGADVEQIPTTSLTRSGLQEGVAVVDLLVQSGLAESKKQARRLIEQGGVRLGEDKVEQMDRMVTLADFADEAVTLRAGKKKIHRFKLLA